MKNKMQSILSSIILGGLFLILAPCPLIHAIAVSSMTVSGAVSKQEAAFGELLNLTYNFEYPPAYKLEVPEKIDGLSPWEVRDIKTIKRDGRDASAQSVVLSIVAYSTGTVRVPSITFDYTDGKNNAGHIKTQPIDVTVLSLVEKYGDLGDIRDIKPPFGIRMPFWLLIMRLLLIAAALYAAYFFYLKYKAKKSALAPAEDLPPAVPPDVTALEELEKLRNSGLPAEGRIKEFYIALSDIIRIYLGAVYSVETLDRTTAEICAELKKKVADKKLVMEIKDLFDECDLVKFAKYRPDEKLCFADLDKAVDIVKHR